MQSCHEVDLPPIQQKTNKQTNKKPVCTFAKEITPNQHKSRG